MISIRNGSIEEVYELAKKIPEFTNPYPLTEFSKRLNGRCLILVAEVEGKIIGFKCGYERERNSTTFYSWMGGVLPGYRGKGVAKELLYEMEVWCRGEGFKLLEFKTLNEHKSMLLFSIKEGFEIVDVVRSVKDQRKRIVLRKTL